MDNEIPPGVARAQMACRTMFTAFSDDFTNAMIDGRAQAWAIAVKACVDMLILSAEPEQKIDRPPSS